MNNNGGRRDTRGGFIRFGNVERKTKVTGFGARGKTLDSDMFTTFDENSLLMFSFNKMLCL